MKTFSYVFLAPGDKVLAVHRRLFAEDRPRLFTGSVVAFEGGLLKVTGHSWSPSKEGFKRKTQPRTKILSLAAGTLIVYQLPIEADLDRLAFSKTRAGVVLTDGHFSLDLSETD